LLEPYQLDGLKGLETLDLNSEIGLSEHLLKECDVGAHSRGYERFLRYTVLAKIAERYLPMPWQVLWQLTFDFLSFLLVRTF
jgi:hypothetical protein